jgi:hypothetical protein
MELGGQNICPTTFALHVWHLRGKLGVNLPHLPYLPHHPNRPIATPCHLELLVFFRSTEGERIPHLDFHCFWPQPARVRWPFQFTSLITLRWRTKYTICGRRPGGRAVVCGSRVWRLLCTAGEGGAWGSSLDGRRGGCVVSTVANSREGQRLHNARAGPSLLTVNYRIKVRLDLQADKSSVVVKGPFFP